MLSLNLEFHRLALVAQPFSSYSRTFPDGIVFHLCKKKKLMSGKDFEAITDAGIAIISLRVRRY